MRHKGKVKLSTGYFAIDVEPFPRLKIMMLCDIIMGLNKQLPDSFNAKHYIHEYIKYIMQVVDENESVYDIETKLPQFKAVEFLIMNLHDQVTLSRIFVEEKPWEMIEKEMKNFDFKEFFFVYLFNSFRKELLSMIPTQVLRRIRTCIERLRNLRDHRPLALNKFK
jgi:hypothetical protein